MHCNTYPSSQLLHKLHAACSLQTAFMIFVLFAICCIVLMYPFVNISQFFIFLYYFCEYFHLFCAHRDQTNKHNKNCVPKNGAEKYDGSRGRKFCLFPSSFSLRLFQIGQLHQSNRHSFTHSIILCVQPIKSQNHHFLINYYNPWKNKIYGQKLYNTIWKIEHNPQVSNVPEIRNSQSFWVFWILYCTYCICMVFFN